MDSQAQGHVPQDGTQPMGDEQHGQKDEQKKPGMPGHAEGQEGTPEGEPEEKQA